MADSDLGKDHEANAGGHAGGAGKTKTGASDSERPSNPAGPHTKPELTDESKTPGTGMLSGTGQFQRRPERLIYGREANKMRSLTVDTTSLGRSPANAPPNNLSSCVRDGRPSG